MATKYVKTYTGANTSFPGTKENPMRPILYIHPVSGKEEQAHYNDRNLQTDADYREAGFEYFAGYGWCWPVQV